MIIKIETFIEISNIDAFRLATINQEHRKHGKKVKFENIADLAISYYEDGVYLDAFDEYEGIDDYINNYLEAYEDLYRLEKFWEVIEE